MRFTRRGGRQGAGEAELRGRVTEVLLELDWKDQVRYRLLPRVLQPPAAFVKIVPL